MMNNLHGDGKHSSGYIAYFKSSGVRVLMLNASYLRDTPEEMSHPFESADSLVNKKAPERHPIGAI
jgi:hypothetical protein